MFADRRFARPLLVANLLVALALSSTGIASAHGHTDTIDIYQRTEVLVGCALGSLGNLDMMDPFCYVIDNSTYQIESDVADTFVKIYETSPWFEPYLRPAKDLADFGVRVVNDVWRELRP